MASDESKSKPGGHGEYGQQLDRSLGLFGNVTMILGAVAPAATFFVYIPVMYYLFGGFTFTALLIGFALQIPMALCYAELGSAYPLAGGEYSMVARTVSRGSGFMIFGMMLFFFIITLAIGAIGAGLQLQTLWPSVDPKLVAVVIIAAGALLGVFNVKEGAIFSGIFLAIQMIAIGIIVVLGLTHLHDPVHRLFSTTVYGPKGVLPFTFTVALAAMTLGFYQFTGYGNAVVFGEETESARKHMGRAVLFPLIIIGVTLILASFCMLVGTPSLQKLSLAPVPTAWFVQTVGGATLNKIVSGLVFLALAEFIMLTTLIVGRELWSASRDNAWPKPVSRLLSTVHSHYKSPWVATVLVAAIAVPFCFMSLASLVTISGVITIVYCGFMGVGALRIRFMKSAPQKRWKMPLWPLPPIIVLVALCFMVTQQTKHDLVITGAVLVIAFVYYLAFLRPRAKTHWVMLEAQSEAEDAAAGSPAVTMAAVAPAAPED